MADATPNQLFEMWRKQVEESTQAWTRLLSQRAPTMAPPDPTAFWRPVLDQGLETRAKLFAQTPATPELLPQSEQALQALQLPSRSQVTAVAKMIVELEERMERLEDRIDAVLRRLDATVPK